MRLESKTLLVIVVAVVLVIVALTALPLLQKNLEAENQTRSVGSNSVVVEARGLRVTLNYSSLNLKLGDHFNYTAELKNINSPSRLSLLQSTGEIDLEVYNDKGGLLWQRYGIYAVGPVGPITKNLRRGQNWTEHESLHVGANIALGAGNYVLTLRFKYYNIDLQRDESIGLQTSLRISD